MTQEAVASLLDRLAAATKTPGAGVTRHSYSPEDAVARDIIRDELRSLGLQSWTDWAGNLNAVLPGRDATLGALVIGSHLDSVTHGGKYDGAVGVVGAIAVLRRIIASGQVPERSIRFVAFAEEEGGNFNHPLLGSQAFAGALSHEDFAAIAGPNTMEFIATQQAGEGTPPALPASRYCLELHIEQSPYLFTDNIQIGVVDRVAADTVVTVSLTGRSGHSGASAMAGRRDALAAAAECVVACETLATGQDGEGAVVTVGFLDCRPNAFNCIPEQVTFTVDMRHPDPEALGRVQDRVEALVDAVASRRDLSIERSAKRTAGVPLDPEVVAVVEQSAEALGYTWRRMPSWAMHDSGALAPTVAAGMIFVPSRDGLSHNPAEFTAIEEIMRGVEVLHAAASALGGLQKHVPQ